MADRIQLIAVVIFAAAAGVVVAEPAGAEVSGRVPIFDRFAVDENGLPPVIGTKAVEIIEPPDWLIRGWIAEDLVEAPPEDAKVMEQSHIYQLTNLLVELGEVVNDLDKTLNARRPVAISYYPYTTIRGHNRVPANGYAVTCSDGSVFVYEDSTWKELPPIPGTKAAAESHGE